MIDKIENLTIYAIEKAIKSYRKFAQRNISRAVSDITIDQWLVMAMLEDNPGISQQELAISLFKDFASITRIIELLVKKGFLRRSEHDSDRRKYTMLITVEGRKIINKLKPIVNRNRTIALAGISKKDIKQLEVLLSKIITNTNL